MTIGVVERNRLMDPVGGVRRDGKNSIDRISPAAVIAQLQKILSSSGFTRARRLREFLAYIVQETIEGRAGELKEYALGVAVFGRHQSFDPRIDPIVRVDAGRLRTRLKEYYRQEGRHDPLHIDCAKGSYVPVFRQRDRSPAASERNGAPRREHRKGTAIAVLPFRDLSPGHDQEYFCEGIAQELICMLSKVSGLLVASRTSSFAYKGRNGDIRQIGKRLNVTAVLEGSVRREGSRVRIAVQLIDVADGFEVWSGVYDCSGHDVLSVQQEIAHSIIEDVQGKIPRAPAGPLLERHTETPEAYVEYLRGRFHWNKRTEEGLNAGIRCFEHAISVDPGYALAYSGMADAYAMLGTRGALAPEKAIHCAERALQKALVLDSNLAEISTSAALLQAVYRWKWQDAEREFVRAFTLNPRYATARHWYAITCLAPLGRLDEGIEHLRTALEFEPVSSIIHTVLGRMLLFQRLYAEAIEQLNTAIALDEDFYMPHQYLGIAHSYAGHFDRAVEHVAAASELSRGGEFVTASLGVAYARAGRTSEAGAVLSRLTALAGDRYVPACEIAQVHAALGNPDAALSWLDRAYSERDVSLAHLWVNPVYDTLHSDSRFVRLSARVGLSKP
jgi:TolB-like protein/tetratricopeptide (TPR) repeat protein